MILKFLRLIANYVDEYLALCSLNLSLTLFPIDISLFWLNLAYDKVIILYFQFNVIFFLFITLHEMSLLDTAGQLRHYTVLGS